MLHAYNLLLQKTVDFVLEISYFDGLPLLAQHKCTATILLVATVNEVNPSKSPATCDADNIQGCTENNRCRKR